MIGLPNLGQLVFNLGQMAELATTLSGIGDRAQLARLKLMLVDPSGLPPEISGHVDSELQRLRGVLDACEGTLDHHGRYLATVVANVRREEGDPGTPLGLKATKVVLPLLSEPSDIIRRTSSPRDERLRRYARAINSILGIDAMNGMIKWSEYRSALHKSRVHANAGGLEKLRRAVGRISRDKVFADARGPREPSSKPRANESGLGRVAGVLKGAVPVTGSFADFYQGKVDAQKLIREWDHSRPKQIRNASAAIGSGLHVAANGAVAGGPLGWIPAVRMEGAAYALDASVLAYDMGEEVVDHAKGKIPRKVVQAAEDVKDTFGFGLPPLGPGAALERVRKFKDLGDRVLVDP